MSKSWSNSVFIVVIFALTSFSLLICSVTCNLFLFSCCGLEFFIHFIYTLVVLSTAIMKEGSYSLSSDSNQAHYRLYSGLSLPQNCQLVANQSDRQVLDQSDRQVSALIFRRIRCVFYTVIYWIPPLNIANYSIPPLS